MQNDDIYSYAGTVSDSELQPIVIPSASLLANLLLAIVLTCSHFDNTLVVFPFLSIKICLLSCVQTSQCPLSKL
jgi:hypothetical protein